MTSWNLAGEKQICTGALFRDGARSTVVEMDMAGVGDDLGHPLAFDLRLTDDAGHSSIYGVEILHTLPLTMTDDNHHLNGIAWDLKEDTVVTIECAARLTAADGTIGYGHVQRGTRRQNLSGPPPTAPRAVAKTAGV
jgi:hypothetical protein